MSHAQVEHFFRHEYGRLVSALARVYGVHRLEAFEDAVQGALMLALTSSALRGTPDEPGAWLYRVAKARVHLERALAKATNHAERELLSKRLAPCTS